MVDHVTPLPLLLAREAINQAQSKDQQDRNTARILLETAKKQVVRARELGYTGKDQDYEALNHQISSLEKQLSGHEDATVAFSKLKDKLSAFLKRQSSEARMTDISGGGMLAPTATPILGAQVRTMTNDEYVTPTD